MGKQATKKVTANSKKQASPLSKPIKKADKPASPVVDMLRKHRTGPKWDLSKLAMG